MQIVRTVVWVVLLVALSVFSAVNWDERATVHIWQNLVVETNVPAIVVVSFLLGFLPTWLLYRASKWQYRRRIGSLETAHRSVAPAAVPVTPADPVEVPAEHPAMRPRDDGPAPVP